MFLQRSTVDQDAFRAAIRQCFEFSRLQDGGWVPAAKDESEFWAEAIPAVFDELKDIAREHGLKMQDGGCIDVGYVQCVEADQDDE